MINKNYSNDELEIIYLTLNRSEPDKESTEGLTKEIKEKIITISYKENILEWLNDCIKEVAEVPIIRETLIQYRSLLKKITGNDVLLADNPELASSLKNRLAYFDSMNYLQVELLKRLRDGDESDELKKAIHISINGLATGLRNSG